MQGIGLSHNDLSGWDFSGQNLKSAHLRWSTLTGANLTAALVTGASLSGVTGFTKEQLYSTASYQAKNLEGIGLSHNDLTGWDFSGQNLTRATFSEFFPGAAANLTNADMSQANLTGADLGFSTLTDANLTGAIFKNVNLENANITRGIFDSGTTYNQWTVFPPDFDPVAKGLTLMPSPMGDFDANDVLDAADIDMLTAEIGGPYEGVLWWLRSMFDVNNDWNIDLEDHTFWVATLKQTWPGDVDLDGEVAFSDFLLLSAHFGAPGGWGQGDFDADGQVQFPDFLILSSNFGQSSTAAAAAVPEPSAALLAIIGWLIFLRMRQRRVVT